VRRKAENKRRTPSIPVISPEHEALDDVELAAEVRQIELETAASVYSRGRSRY
jgi:hypothetical protein